MRIPHKFQIKDLLSIFFYSPWLGLFVSFFAKPFQSRLSFISIALAFIMFMFAFFAVFHNQNFNAFVNWVLLILLLIFSSNQSYYKKINSLPSLFIADIYVLFGLIVMIYVVIISPGSGTNRWGLYGGEPNFTGIVVLSYMLINLIKGVSKTKLVYLLILYGFVLYCTVSRTFFVCSILFTYYYLFKDKRFLITLTFLIFAGVVFFGSSVVSALDKYGLFAISGYSEGFERLISLNDYSSQHRLKLQDNWYSEIGSSLKNLMFGMPISDYNFLVSTDLNVHNSFIQKTGEYGIIFVFLFIILTFKYLPLWFVYCLFSYSLFLHNILSIPWVLVLSFFMHNQIKND